MKKDEIINYILEHKAEFIENFGVRKIGVFGSYARGENYEGSDVDIVVDLEKPDMFYLIGIKQSIEEALGVKVDVIRLRNRMNQFLKKRIERDAVYV